MNDLDALRAYRYAVAEVRAVAEQVEELKTLPRAARDARLSSLEALLDQRQAELDAIARQFEALLRKVRDPRTQMVLRQYYGLGLSDEKVALVSGMSMRTVNKVRNRFLRDWAVVQEAHGEK